MRVVITGATGLIGKALCENLASSYEIIALSRNPQKAQSILGPGIKVVDWLGDNPDDWMRYIDGANAVVNLAGESIASGRWTKTRKHRILQSRLNATRVIVEAITKVNHKPEVLIQASATGFYGNDRQQPLDENAGPGSGFLAGVCAKWEELAKPVEQVKTRLVVIRSGLVLSREGGALLRLMMPFKFFLGGWPGSGKQQVSWITIDDEIAAIKFLIENTGLSGVFNLTSPNSVTMRQLCEAIGQALHRPCRLKIPALALRLIFGKMADETMLAGQNVRPERLLKAGFKFTCPNIDGALEYLLTKGESSGPGEVF